MASHTHPDRHSVNDGIDSAFCSMTYASVDNAAAIITKLGTNILLAKIDVAHAYHNIPVHPDDCGLLGMIWGDQLFVDTVLPFGLRSAPKIFCAVADTLEWNRGVTHILHYLDDFLTVGAPNTNECLDNLLVSPWQWIKSKADYPSWCSWVSCLTQLI